MPVGLRLPELIVLAVIALLVFGPKKLPEMGAAIGKSITSFKKGMKEVSSEASKEMKDEEPESAEQKQLEARRLELEALELEIASKKAAASAHEAMHAEKAD